MRDLAPAYTEVNCSVTTHCYRAGRKNPTWPPVTPPTSLPAPPLGATVSHLTSRLGTVAATRQRSNEHMLKVSVGEGDAPIIRGDTINVLFFAAIITRCSPQETQAPKVCGGKRCEGTTSTWRFTDKWHRLSSVIKLIPISVQFVDELCPFHNPVWVMGILKAVRQQSVLMLL